MMSFALRLILVGSLLLSLPAIAAANLLTNGDFENDIVPSSPGYIRSSSQPTAWTQFGNGVDILSNSYFPQITTGAQSGLNWLDLNQNTPSSLLGGIYQDLAVTPNSEVILSLWAVRWADNADGTIRYSLIDPLSNTTLATDTYIVDGTWTQRTLSATTNGSGQLRVQIHSIVSEQAAPGLDNVSLVYAVPTPAALPMGLSLLTLLALRRRA